MKTLNPIRMAGGEILPLIEGGKGISATNGESSGAWAAAGGVGTFSGVNADAFDADGNVVPQVYHGKTRRERHEELIKFSVLGGIAQAKIAHEIAGGQGRLHMNVLWEMGACERILHGILEGAPGLVNGVTCGAGMPYKVAEISAQYGVYYYPIVSSARAFRALWKRSYHKHSEWLGAVVYEDPWRAGGHNGLSNVEDPNKPEDPFPRVKALRDQMNDFGLHDTPIIMAGGVWFLRDWADWIDNPELGPVAFQFGTRPLLTQESPIPDGWKNALLNLEEGDVFLNRFSPTGFYSSAHNNSFIKELRGRSDRQVKFSTAEEEDRTAVYGFGPRNRATYVTPEDLEKIKQWEAAGFDEAMKTPDNTLIFVPKERAKMIVKDQQDCMGCLSACKFSNWTQHEPYSTNHKPDPRSFCIQKTLQNIAHGENPETELMFAGHGAYNFAKDPFYANGFIPTVKQLVERLQMGD